MVLRLTCLASAMVALSAGATAAAQTPDCQPTPADPPAKSQDDIILRADVITEDQQNLVMTAEGNVEVRVGERTLRADRLIYDQGKRDACAPRATSRSPTIDGSDPVLRRDRGRRGFPQRLRDALLRAARAATRWSRPRRPSAPTAPATRSSRWSTPAARSARRKATSRPGRSVRAAPCRTLKAR